MFHGTQVPLGEETRLWSELPGGHPLVVFGAKNQRIRTRHIFRGGGFGERMLNIDVSWDWLGAM